MGSSELISIDSYDESKVEIEGSACMSLCKDGDKRPPYALVNGKVFSRVTPEVIKSIIEEMTDAI